MNSEIHTIDVDTLNEWLEQADALRLCLADFPTSSDVEKVVSDVMESVHTEWDSSHDINPKDIDVVLPDRSKKLIVEEMSDKIDSANSIVRDVYDRMVRNLLVYFKYDVQQPLSSMVLDPYTWVHGLCEMAPNELVKSVLSQMDPTSDEGASWGRSIAKYITSNVVVEEFQKVWRDNNHQARQWETHVFSLVREKDQAQFVDRCFSPLWQSHAIRSVLKPEETIDGQSHQEICNHLEEMGARVSWSHINLAPFLGADPSADLQKRVNDFFNHLTNLCKMDPLGAAQSFGSLTENPMTGKAGWSSWVSRLQNQPNNYQHVAPQKSLLAHMASNGWTCFASLQEVCRSFDKAEKGNERLWEQKLLECCAAIQAETMVSPTAPLPKSHRKM